MLLLSQIVVYLYHILSFSHSNSLLCKNVKKNVKNSYLVYFFTSKALKKKVLLLRDFSSYIIFIWHVYTE